MENDAPTYLTLQNLNLLGTLNRSGMFKNWWPSPILFYFSDILNSECVTLVIVFLVQS